MSQEEVQQAKDVFASFDTDRDGALTYSQTYDALFSLGYDVKRVIRGFDEKRAGYVKLGEFLHMYTACSRISIDSSALQASVRHVNGGGGGPLTAATLQHIMTHDGLPKGISEKDLKILTSSVGFQRGVVDQREFVRFLTG